MKCTQMFTLYTSLIAMLGISLVLSINTFSVEGSQVYRVYKLIAQGRCSELYSTKDQSGLNQMIFILYSTNCDM